MRSRLKRTTLLAVFWLGGQLAHLVASVWMLVILIASPHGGRGQRIALAWDQLANAAFGGSEDETISSRAGRARRAGRRWGCVLCRLLDALDPGHCEASIETHLWRKP